MKYDRLTKRDEDGTPQYNGGHYDTLALCYDKLLCRLAELEDKIERGELQEIQEGAVVLTREVCDDIKNALEVSRAYMVKEAYRMGQARKETIKEVAHYLDNEKGFCGLGYMTAKHFGVELDE